MLDGIESVPRAFEITANKGKFQAINPVAEQMGTVESAGKELYTTFSFPFELVSFILLAAIIGAIVLAKKKFD